MEDPYLSSFLNDMLQILYGMFAVFEFLIGLSYFCGKQLAGGIVTASLLTWDALCEAYIYAGCLFEQIIELEKFILDCIFVIYFAICQIFEAFYITFNDLKNILIHFVGRLSTLCQDTSSAVAASVQALTIIPEQLWAALSIVGDFTFSSLYNIKLLVVDFSIQLIMAPVRVVVLVVQSMLSILSLPRLIFKDMTFSAIIGVCVLVALYYIFQKKVFNAVFRLAWMLVKWIWNAFGRMSSQLYCLVFRHKSRYDDEATPSPTKPTKGICVVCQENPVVFIAQPCHHVCLCRDCVRTLVDFDSRCPMCRRPVDQYERVYIP